MRFFFLMFFAFCTFAFCADTNLDAYTQITSCTVIACAILLGLAALGGALGMGNVSQSAITGIARNPSVSNKISTTMYVCLAMVEAQVIYALVITFILLFANPFISETLKKAIGA